ncbi:CsbD family protein [Marinobacter sp.]|uniref:CsbD family protein n=1 Tax=Marinobacter sp. TaxID=50741 RepID=UPI00356430BA
MNKDTIEGNWKELKGRVKEQWGKLTDDRLDEIAGKREQLAGEIQQAYGVTREEAERQLKDFEASSKH